jgi:hypothetical protein
MTTDRTFQEDAHAVADAIVAELGIVLDPSIRALVRTSLAYAWLQGSRDGGEAVMEILRRELAAPTPERAAS